MAKLFLSKFNRKMQASCTITDEAYNWISQQHWEGNVRELENFIERTIAFSGSVQIDLPTIKDLLPPHNILVPISTIPENPMEDGDQVLNLEEILAGVEKKLLQKAWSQGRSSYSVARMLRISQNKAYRLLKKYNINNANP